MQGLDLFYFVFFLSEMGTREVLRRERWHLTQGFTDS